MAIQVTLSDNQFNHSGTYNDKQYTSLQVNYTSKGRIYFTTVHNGMRLSTMAKQVKYEDGNAFVSFGKNDKLIVGTYTDDTIQEEVEEVMVQNTNEVSVNTLDKAKCLRVIYCEARSQFLVENYNLSIDELNNSYDEHLNMISNRLNTMTDNDIMGFIQLNCTLESIDSIDELYEAIESATTNNTVDQLEYNSVQPIKEDKGVNNMETKSVNQLSNKDLTNILTKFAAMSETRPVLNYGYFNGQNIYATDTHKAISIDKSLIDYLNNESDTHLYDILKGEKSDDKLNFPNIERLFDINADEEFTINKKEIVRLHKLIGTIKKELSERYLYNIKLQFETSNSKLMIKGYTQNGDYKETESFNTGIVANNVTIILNASFLSDTLNTYKKLMRITGDKELNVSYTSHLRPIKFNLQSGLVNVLLMPIRKY